MLDFTSSLYLNIKHSSEELQSWSQLTTGVPAALYESVQNKNLANCIARMQGMEAGIIAPSTLHLYTDLYDLLSNKKITLFIDEKIYPVSKYGIEKLIINNIPVYCFKHGDANHLYKLVKDKLQNHTTPIVFTDGYCPQCGKALPLKDYSLIMQQYAGNIIVDDTQAFGIFGKRKDEFAYGYDGSGILQWLNITDENIITITSLAKTFGVPAAAIAGNKNFIKEFKANSKTRESSSSVSNAHLNAIQNAMFINNQTGNIRRRKLLNNVKYLKHAMPSFLKLTNVLFPVQSIMNLDSHSARNLFDILNERNVKTVLTQDHYNKPVLTFIIRSDHSKQDIQYLTDVINKTATNFKKGFI